MNCHLPKLVSSSICSIAYMYTYIMDGWMVPSIILLVMGSLWLGFAGLHYRYKACSASRRPAAQ